MSLQNFFLKDQDLSKSIEQNCNDSVQLLLSKEDLHHAKVLRLNPGEHIGVIDCNSVFYECEIVDFDKELIVKNCQKDSNFKKQFSITLFPGITKGNKLDDVIRSCTEIGVDRFIPVMFKRSVVKLDEKKQRARLDRWEKIAKSAAMQSGRKNIPNIDNVSNIKELINSLKNYDCVFVFWEESDNLEIVKKTCDDLKRKNDLVKIAILVGPEGGIDSDEIKQISSCNNVVIASLGNTILRTQTADIVACSIVDYLMSC